MKNPDESRLLILCWRRRKVKNSTCQIILSEKGRGGGSVEVNIFRQVKFLTFISWFSKEAKSKNEISYPRGC